MTIATEQSDAYRGPYIHTNTDPFSCALMGGYRVSEENSKRENRWQDCQGHPRTIFVEFVLIKFVFGENLDKTFKRQVSSDCCAISITLIAR